ncbi:flagellar assembly protein FliW [Microbacterium sp.]|uniref:flagellar assembly protein FliW n=1 Tax=Microbacterium sp. TaxID=51671 RepID=UPI0028109D18|nr:flagellar assembly protein FliW [Microbacterium sp.]
MSAAVVFVAPPPGLAPHTDFDLSPVDGADGLFALSAHEDAELRLFLVDPRTVLADYAPELTDEQAAQLALAEPDDALLLVVANPGPDGVHVNLLAPVVVNTATGAAAQLILDGQDYPVRAPLA